MTSIVIPDAVTSIGEYAFESCANLSSITIGKGVTSIGFYAFSGCSSLTSIIVDEDNLKYDSRNNCNAIIETASNTLIVGCKNSVIPCDVTSIGDYAFFGCSSLTSIVIPDAVTSIGDFAFAYCSNLSSVTLGKGVTSIGYKAFAYCSNLKGIILGSSVEQIGGNFIQDCPVLESITVTAKTPPVIEWLEMDDAYYNSITVYVPVGSLSAYQSADVWSRFWNIQEFDATGVVRPTISNEDIDAPVYNLNGERMMNKTNLPKGIYIQNGKKFIVR